MITCYSIHTHNMLMLHDDYIIYLFRFSSFCREVASTQRALTSTYWNRFQFHSNYLWVHFYNSSISYTAKFLRKVRERKNLVLNELHAVHPHLLYYDKSKWVQIDCRHFPRINKFTTKICHFSVTIRNLQ